MNLRLPPAIWVILFSALIWLLDKLLPWGHFSLPFQAALSWFLFLFGTAVVLGAIVHFAQAKTTVNPINPEQASSLVSNGIYRLSRNPMYLGFLLMLGGFAVKTGNWLGFSVLPLFILTMNRIQILPEEQALEQRFGAAYRDYKKRVRRWL